MIENCLEKCSGYAIQGASYLHNRILCSSINDNIPHEIKSLRKPDFSQIKVFVCDVNIKITDSHRRKLDTKCQITTFVGKIKIEYRVTDQERLRFKKCLIQWRKKYFVKGSATNSAFNPERSDGDSGKVKQEIQREMDLTENVEITEENEEPSGLRKSHGEK